MIKISRTHFLAIMNKKTYCLITVDTEASMYKGKPLPVDKMIYGKIDGEYHGVGRIMDICDKYNVRATFFVSVLEAFHYGKDIYKELCENISARGHDVQLHIHPNWRFDPNRGRMWEYSLQEQIEIVREAKKMFIELTGVCPVAHRAGGLAGDCNTLTALKENEIPMDSSTAYGYEFSRLSGRLPNKNAVSLINGVAEIPVTVFTQFDLAGIKFMRNFDINADTYGELINVVNCAQKGGLKIINLLMHSFSFVDRNKDRTEFSPNQKDAKKFEDLLRYIGESDYLQCVTFKELYEIYKNNSDTFAEKDIVPYSGITRTFIRANKSFTKSWKNAVFVCGIYLLFIVVVVCVFVVIV